MFPMFTQPISIMIIRPKSNRRLLIVGNQIRLSTSFKFFAGKGVKWTSFGAGKVAAATALVCKKTYGQRPTGNKQFNTVNRFYFLSLNTVNYRVVRLLAVESWDELATLFNAED